MGSLPQHPDSSKMYSQTRSTPTVQHEQYEYPLSNLSVHGVGRYLRYDRVNTLSVEFVVEMSEFVDIPHSEFVQYPKLATISILNTIVMVGTL